MRIFIQIYLIAQCFVQATDYRAGSFEYMYLPNESRLTVRRRMAWQRFAAGYVSGCTGNDVYNETQSDRVINETIVNFSGDVLLDHGKSGTSGTYRVTELDVSDKLNFDDHYCFGTNSEIFVVNEPFIHRGEGCCTTDLTDDDGNSVASANYTIEAKVNDIFNDSPTVYRIPNRWNIMFGCNNQQLNLAPVDNNGDSVRCRWATFDEAGGMARVNGRFDSLVLDEENCIITYVPGQNASPGTQPIAIQIEDFDSEGNIRSSIPVQLRANIWTPAADFPAYCDGRPSFKGNTPNQGRSIGIWHKINILFTASYTWNNEERFDIDRIVYSLPPGMTCTGVNKFTGDSYCSWEPDDDLWSERSTELCAIAYDPMNRNSDQVCVTLYLDFQTVTNLPECNVCSGAGLTTAQTYADCKSSMALQSCNSGDICGVEVRMDGGEVTQLDIRCFNELQCLRSLNNNFMAPFMTQSTCRPEHKLQTRRFGQSTCYGCLRACGNREPCFDPTTASFNLDALPRIAWTDVNYMNPNY